MNFTKASIEKLEASAKRAYFMDEGGAQSVKGLGLTVTPKGSKSFFVRATVHGQTKRISLGKFPDVTVAIARQMAAKKLGDIAQGIDPVQQRRDERAARIRSEQASITLSEVLELYLTRKNLREGSEYAYRTAIGKYFKNYLDRPLSDIDKTVINRVNDKHRASASSSLRALRAVFNFASVEYEDADLFQDNPVAVLSKQKTWHKYKRKSSYIHKEDLSAWFDAVEQLDTVNREYFQFLLFSGIRAKTEASSLTWDRINWRANTFTLLDTKNGTDVELPLPAYITPMLKKRKKKDGLVFPNTMDSRVQREKVTAMSGVPFTRHDLRRTFLTIAESIDLSWLTVKRLANHATQEVDVTSGYISVDQDRLHQASRKIGSKILMDAGRLNADVTELHA